MRISDWSSDVCSADLARDASFGGRLPLCLVEHRHQRVERVFETGGGEIVLALEIISDAGGVEPDAPRDIGEGHALRALGVDRLGRGGENRVALGTKSLRAAFVALGYRLRPLHPPRLPASFRKDRKN